MKNKECSDCGYIGHPIHDEYSSLVLDITAWGVSFVFAAISGIIYLAVLGPLFSIWHLVTFRSHRCPECGNWEMHKRQDHSHSHSHTHSH